MEMQNSRPPRAVARFLGAYLQRRHAVLFYSLLLSVAAIPIMNTVGMDSRLVELLLGFNLLTAAIVTDRGPMRRSIVVVVLLAVALRVASEWLQRDGYTQVSIVIWGLMAILVAGRGLRFAFRSGAVEGEHLFAVLNAYLLAGLFFGLFYHVIEASVPGSFAIGGTVLRGELPIADAIYFSFVTLATLGYGDIVPVSEAGRGLVIFETVGGQLYIAVLVARLVGLRR